MKRTPLVRKTRLRAVNPERRARTFARNYGERGGPIRAMQCAVRGHSRSATLCGGRIEAAHVVARGMGGAHGDRRDLVPLCGSHHWEQTMIGVGRFEKKYGLNLTSLAATLATEMDKAGIA